MYEYLTIFVYVYQVHLSYLQAEKHSRSSEAVVTNGNKLPCGNLTQVLYKSNTCFWQPHFCSLILEFGEAYVLANVSVVAVKNHYQKVSWGAKGLYGLHFHIATHR